MGANFNFQVAPTGSYPSLYLSQNVTFSHLLFGRVLSQGKGRKNILPYEGGLKVGADFNSHISLTGHHPSLYLSQNVTFSHLLFGRVLSQGKGRKNILPYEGGLKVGADFNSHISLTGHHPSLYLSQNVTFSHLLFGRVLVREGDKLCNKCAMTCHLKHLQKFVISDLFRNLWFVFVVNNYDCWFVILYFFRII